MNSILSKSIESVTNSDISFAKFITANDVGATGAHQAGFHMPKNSWKLFFTEEGRKGANKDSFVTLRWQDDFETDSRYIYYGTGTRNEYRLTRFGRNFPFLSDEHIGSLLVISKSKDEGYNAYVLDADDDIDEFINSVNLSVKDINGLIPKDSSISPELSLNNCFQGFINRLNVDFPPSIDLATSARECYNSAYGVTKNDILKYPDNQILGWLDAEFQLFKVIENSRYSKRIKTPFRNVEELVQIANSILNRRKSRAGKSLEHHLSEIFGISDIPFSNQAISENNKRPDFIFPGGTEYSDTSFPESKLAVLAAKTTCKDRWRQILNEADRIKTKHLFTLQQGISRNQLEEMYNYNVCLVVPKSYLTSFPAEFRDRILTLDHFITHIQGKIKS